MILIYLLVLLLTTLISLGIAVLMIVQFISEFTTDAPFVPIPREIEDKIIENLKLNPNSILYDLGCGDGRILIKAVQKYPEIRTVGVEIAFLPFLLSKFYTRKYKNISIKRENIFKADISSATHIFLYLYPAIVSRLFVRIRKQCKSGTRIVSCDFEINSVTPTEVVDLNNPNSKRGKKLFVYTI